MFDNDELLMIIMDDDLFPIEYGCTESEDDSNV